MGWLVGDLTERFKWAQREMEKWELCALRKRPTVIYKRNGKYGSLGKSWVAVAVLYYCVLTLNPVLFQCKQDIGQFYYLFLESLSRVKMSREEASGDLFHYWNCQNNFLQIIPHFLLATSDIQYPCCSCHMSFLAHPASPVFQRASYPSYEQVLRNEEKKEEMNGGK